VRTGSDRQKRLDDPNVCIGIRVRRSSRKGTFSGQSKGRKLLIGKVLSHRGAALQTGASLVNCISLQIDSPKEVPGQLEAESLAPIPASCLCG
jgi:hypothetical protein